MARGGRKYARDNRGRFASVGATARGGRLRTAAGNKRATVTVKAKGGGKGTIAKPKGLKPGTIKPKQSAPAAPKARNRKVDYAGGVAMLSRQASAIQRLKSPPQTFNGNGSWSRQIDIRTARNTPMGNARDAIKAAYGSYRRTQGTAKNPYASAESKQRAARELPKLRRQVVGSVRAARAFLPEFSGETKRRYLDKKQRATNKKR